MPRINFQKVKEPGGFHKGIFLKPTLRMMLGKLYW
jgi:hypothetical protein